MPVCRANAIIQFSNTRNTYLFTSREFNNTNADFCISKEDNYNNYLLLNIYTHFITLKQLL